MPTHAFITANDPRLIWSGAISLQYGDRWVMPWRLPYSDLALHPDDNLRLRASMPSGVRLRFATDAQTVTFHMEPLPLSLEGTPAVVNYDLYADDKLVATIDAASGDTTIEFDQLPAGMKTLELWLYQMMPIHVRGFALPAGASVERAEDTRPRWVTYGSSITHCRAAGSPSFTWPGVVARAMGFNLTSLGYGGQCHADPMLARMIRDLPADLISLKLGINIQGGSSMSRRAFLPAVIGSIATIRDRHPETPLVICSPIWSPPRESMPNAVGMTLEIMRENVAHAVDVFRERGDGNIYYVDGLRLCGPEMRERLPDELHPDAEGYRMMGENFIQEVFERQGVNVPGMKKPALARR